MWWPEKIFIISFPAAKVNLIYFNCQGVNINPLCALIKFHKDLAIHNIDHIRPDLVTEQKFNNKKKSVRINARMHLTQA